MIKFSSKNKSMVIVCGGKGKRMGKVLKKIPKAMIKLDNKTIIEHKINYYQSQGIKNFIYCTGYKSKMLKTFLVKKNIEGVFNNAGLNAGILKRIYSVKKFIKNNTIISYGDTLAKIKFKKLLKDHALSKCPITLVVAPIQNPFGIVKWNDNSLATSFSEKPTLNHFIGYAVISPNFFDSIPKKIINMNDGLGMIEAINLLIKKRKVNIFAFKELQITINSPDDLVKAKTKFNKYFTLDENI
tara:strand:+ start:330 stop:1055 length:726 start_codon:yes stop_codon:yes gene_type:complete